HADTAFTDASGSAISLCPDVRKPNMRMRSFGYPIPRIGGSREIFKKSVDGYKVQRQSRKVAVKFVRYNSSCTELRLTRCTRSVFRLLPSLSRGSTCRIRR